MRINCIAIDDEPASREILQKFILECPALNLIGIYKNAIEASEVVCNKDVQLIFLDINMPRLSGLSFYKSLNNPPYVIFTTAHLEYAVEGFEVDAIDYLLKPFSFERFLKAVNRARKKCKGNQQKNNDYILLKSDKKFYKIVFDEINYLEALGDYVKVNYSNRSILVHETFRNLLAQLPNEKFARVHKSYAIGLNKFELIEGNKIKMKDKSIPIGQTFRSDFLELIKSLGS